MESGRVESFRGVSCPAMLAPQCGNRGRMSPESGPTRCHSPTVALTMTMAATMAATVAVAVTVTMTTATAAAPVIPATTTATTTASGRRKRSRRRRQGAHGEFKDTGVELERGRDGREIAQEDDGLVEEMIEPVLWHEIPKDRMSRGRLQHEEVSELSIRHDNPLGKKERDMVSWDGY